MLRTITPATPNASTAASGPGLTWFLSIPRQLWLRHRCRADLRNLLHLGPRLIADSGMMMEDIEQMADAPFWQSAHVPALRHF